MVAGLTYEVVARYLFNAPTVWAYDMTFMLYGTFFMLGSAYTLMRKGHIRTDTFYANWSPRVQGAVDAVCYVILLPALVDLPLGGLGLFHPLVRPGRAAGDEPLDADRLSVQVRHPADRGAAAPAERLGVPEEPLGRAHGRVALSPEIVGLLSLAVLFVAIFIGFPIAFTLIVVSLGFGWLVLGKVVVNLMVLQIFAVMRDPTLASMPFFLFMGYLLERAGLMERLFLGFQMMFAGLRGSLYLAVLVTATIFAAATGIVGSSVTLLGVMAAPAMQRSGYDVPLSAGVITAGGHARHPDPALGDADRDGADRRACRSPTSSPGR